MLPIAAAASNPRSSHSMAEGKDDPCAGCRKEVFDFSNCSIGEVRDLQRKHGPICGSIKVVRAAAVAASLTAGACQDSGTTRTMGKPLPPPKGQTGCFDTRVGEIAVPHQEEPVHEIRLPGMIRLPEESAGKTGE